MHLPYIQPPTSRCCICLASKKKTCPLLPPTLTGESRWHGSHGFVKSTSPLFSLSLGLPHNNRFVSPSVFVATRPSVDTGFSTDTSGVVYSLYRRKEDLASQVRVEGLSTPRIRESTPSSSAAGAATTQCTRWLPPCRPALHVKALSDSGSWACVGVAGVRAAAVWATSELGCGCWGRVA